MTDNSHEGISTVIERFQSILDISKIPTKSPVYLSVDSEDGHVLNVRVRNISHRIDLPRDVLYAYSESATGILFAVMIPNNAITQQGGCLRMFISPKADRRLVRFRWEFETSNLAELFVRVVNREASISLDLKLRTVVMINPVSGTKQSGRVWEKVVFPVLEESKRFEIVSVEYTNHPHHAMEIIESLDLLGSPPDAIIALGGDGLVNEIFNGIYLGYPGHYRDILNRVTVCPLPSGTGNGLCWSSLCAAGEPFTMNCALRQLIRFRTGKRDLGQVEYSDDFDASADRQKRLFSLTLSWGLVADVDILSERLRFLGDGRFAIYGLTKIFKRKLYSGSLELGEEQSSEIFPDVITVYATIVPVAGRTMVFDPALSLSSGTVSVYKFLARDLSRMQLVHAMDELAKVRNHEPFIPGFVPAKVATFELVPDLRSQGGAGIVVDGEPLTRGPVTVSVLPSVTNCLVD